MSVEANAGEWLRVRLPEEIDTASVSATVARLAAARQEGPLDLDLADATAVDIAGLTVLLSVLDERSAARQETLISLPRNPAMTDFLLECAFSSAAAMVSRSQFGTLRWADGALPIRDQVRLLRPVPSRPSGNAYERLRDERFFGFLTYSFQADPQIASIVATEWSRWRGPVVLSFLDTELSNRGAEVARVLIYELLTNAVLHPGGDLLTVGSWVTETESGDPEQLVISLWDNGDSMVRTLRTGLSANQPIRVAEAAVDDAFTVEPANWDPRWATYTARWTPGPGATDEELLLASVFPGISHRTTKTPPKSLTRTRELPQEYGLHALYRCAIDLFGGSLEIRTGNQQLNLAGAPQQPRRGPRRYRAHLAHVAGQPFHGNLLTVRLPLRHGR
ncbi:hypothetical protein [Amycolatopsis solani]|uniref:hypothetical protein n=1 Tax=Amycolatopsis solani TaxID=3028615 RepID=UPI0025B211FA|nr:hypothetical protein [Amycolatopsis sp. MEP2-6]